MILKERTNKMTAADATSATYQNGAKVKNLTATNGGTVELYAVWR